MNVQKNKEDNITPDLDESKENSLKDIIKSKDYPALANHLKEGINDYLKSDTFKNFLDFVSQFHHYSERNIRLILAQNPKTRHIASYNKWKEMDNPVKRGGKATYIYAPNPVIKRDENNKPMKDENGEVIKFMHYKLVPVFAESETTNPALLPQQIYNLPENLEDPKRFIKLYKGLESVSPAPIQLTNIEGRANGYFRPSDNTITVQKGMGEEMTLRTMIHEITHSILHTNSQANFGDPTYTRQEFEAESVSYIVSKHLGIDTSDYAFGYLSSWTNQGEKIDTFESSLETITKQAQTLIDKLDLTLEKVYTLNQPSNKFEERLEETRNRSKTKRAEPKEVTKNTDNKVVEPDPKVNRPQRTR